MEITWYLLQCSQSDEPSTEKLVREAIKGLNIQVDNLWFLFFKSSTYNRSQFLPQDRVSAFANMHPPELLRETERAAGGMELLEMHNTMIKTRESEKKLQAVCFLACSFSRKSR